MDALLAYDEASLRRVLSGLSPWQRALFATTVAERLHPACAALREASRGWSCDSCDAALAEAWRYLEAPSTDTSRFASLLARCEREQPAVSLDCRLQPAAEDAVVAVLYALGAILVGDDRNPAWAARRAYHAVDRAAILSGNLRNPRGPTEERRVLSEPVVQRELGRQRRDLDEIAAARPGTDAAARMRARARLEALDMLRT